MPTTSDFEHLPPDVLSAQALFYRERDITSVRVLAAEMGLPVARVENPMCRGFATLVARGYPADLLCEVFTLTPAQLKRAAMAPPFGDGFRPIGEWRSHDTAPEADEGSRSETEVLAQTA